MENASLMASEMSEERKADIRLFFSGQYKKIVNSFQKRYGDISRMEIEDVVSDLMTDLLSKADFAGQIENTGAYIYRAVQNRLVDYLRRKKKTSRLDDVNMENEQASDMQKEFDSIEIRKRLAKALDNLNPAERKIWIATSIDGLTFRELSKMWKIPIGTLLARKHRANAVLQKHLYDLKNY